MFDVLKNGSHDGVKKMNVNRLIKKKEGEVVTSQPNHSITSLPPLLENHIANELIKAINIIERNILNN